MHSIVSPARHQGKKGSPNELMIDTTSNFKLERSPSSPGLLATTQDAKENLIAFDQAFDKQLEQTNDIKIKADNFLKPTNYQTNLQVYRSVRDDVSSGKTLSSHSKRGSSSSRKGKTLRMLSSKKSSDLIIEQPALLQKLESAAKGKTVEILVEQETFGPIEDDKEII